MERISKEEREKMEGEKGKNEIQKTIKKENAITLITLVITIVTVRLAFITATIRAMIAVPTAVAGSYFINRADL